MEQQAITKNKEQQFRQWVDGYSDLLYRYGLERVGNEELAKDLVQEAFLAAWRNMDGYRGEASVKNWLFVILKSKIIDHFRRASSRQEVELIFKEHQESKFFDEEDHWRKGLYPQQWTVDFSNTVETREFYKVFHSCSSKLKEIQNSVFAMKYLDGLQCEEICKLLSISQSNYWVIIHRAKVQLRACLEKNWLHK